MYLHKLELWILYFHPRYTRLTVESSFGRRSVFDTELLNFPYLSQAQQTIERPIIVGLG